MEIEQINSTLRQQAINLAACAKGMQGWRSDLQLDELLNYYKLQSQFCLAKDYPSLEFIKANFDKKLCSIFGIYIDDEGLNLKLDNGTYIFRQAQATIAVKQIQAVALKVSNSDLTINVAPFASLTLSIYNGGEYSVNAYDGARATIFDYSDSAAKINTQGQVNVYKKMLPF
jgi:hypothetical protein